MDAITQLKAQAQRLQEEVDSNHHTIQDQNGKIKMLHEEIATLHEAQGQNMKDMGEIHTGFQNLSLTVTDIVGRLETINVAPLSLSNVKSVKCCVKLEGKATFVNKRNNTWNVSEVIRYAIWSAHLEYCNSSGITLTHGGKPKGKLSAQMTCQDGRKQMVSKWWNILCE